MLERLISFIKQVFHRNRWQKHFLHGSEEPTDFMEFLEERESRRTAERTYNFKLRYHASRR